MSMSLRDTFRDMTPDEMRTASREAELSEWRRTNRRCGCCGAEMAPHADPGERALVCPACGYTVYPRIAPAVIALVTKVWTQVRTLRTPFAARYARRRPLR